MPELMNFRCSTDTGAFNDAFNQLSVTSFSVSDDNLRRPSYPHIQLPIETEANL